MCHFATIKTEDTGGRLTLVSRALFYRIHETKRISLELLTQAIISANGTELSIGSKGKFCIELYETKYGKEKFIVEALFTDLFIGGILGLDVMEKND